MPSSQLAQLAQQIEAQHTDHFGKFYMYVSLLNTLTVRNKTWADRLPTYSSFWGDRRLNIGGELPHSFTRDLQAYAPGFVNTQPDWSKTLKDVVWSYFRKGHLSDLVYIIDQMQLHLGAIVADEHNPNYAIYRAIGFDRKKGSMSHFLGQISTFNHQLLAQADSGVNLAICVLLVTTSLALALSTFLIPMLIGSALFAVGAYGVYHYATKSKSLAREMKETFSQIQQQAAELPRDNSFFGDANYASFYVAALKPLPYAAVTACEQLMINAEQQRQLSEFRGQLDTCFSRM